MAFDRPIRDIARGDIWIECATHQRVIVVTAGNRYVEFMRGRDRIEIYYERHFRERFEPIYDRPALRSQFSMSRANLAAFHVFYSLALGRMFARSATCSPDQARAPARGRPPVPPDAVFINTYAEPASAEMFLQDLDDVIAAAGA